MLKRTVFCWDFSTEASQLHISGIVPTNSLYIYMQIERVQLCAYEGWGSLPNVGLSWGKGHSTMTIVL